MIIRSILCTGFLILTSVCMVISVQAAGLSDLQSVDGFGAIRSGACIGPAHVYCNVGGAGLLKKVVGNIYTVMISLATGIAVCVLIYASILMITAQGSEDKLSKGRTIFVVTLVGVIFVLASLAFVKGACEIMMQGKWFPKVVTAACAPV